MIYEFVGRLEGAQWVIAIFSRSQKTPQGTIKERALYCDRFSFVSRIGLLKHIHRTQIAQTQENLRTKDFIVCLNVSWKAVRANRIRFKCLHRVYDVAQH